MVAASERGDHDNKPVPVIKLANPAVPAFKNPLRSIVFSLCLCNAVLNYRGDANHAKKPFSEAERLFSRAGFWLGYGAGKDTQPTGSERHSVPGAMHCSCSSPPQVTGNWNIANNLFMTRKSFLFEALFSYKIISQMVFFNP
jgi:hypothetical protein